jgi:hypothetical protein
MGASLPPIGGYSEFRLEWSPLTTRHANEAEMLAESIAYSLDEHGETVMWPRPCADVRGLYTAFSTSILDNTSPTLGRPGTSSAEYRLHVRQLLAVPSVEAVSPVESIPQGMQLIERCGFA